MKVESRREEVVTCNLHVNERLYLPSVLTMACIRNTIFLVRQTKLDLYITKTSYIMGAFYNESLYVTLETLLQLFMKTSSSQRMAEGEKRLSLFTIVLTNPSVELVEETQK